MTTLLAEYTRRAAHGKHRCQLCGELIEVATMYLDQRCVNDGSAYTFRCHTSCNARYRKAARAFGMAEDDMLDWGEVLLYEAESGTLFYETPEVTS